MSHEIFIEHCTSDQTKHQISNSLKEYNLYQVCAVIPERIAFNYCAKNDKQEITGGILASLGYWGGLEIEVLWVGDKYYYKGIGTRLLLLAESEAKKRGAILSLVDTFDFQAPGFYLKNGYEIWGEHKGFPPGHSRYYLQKKLI